MSHSTCITDVQFAENPQMKKIITKGIVRNHERTGKGQWVGRYIAFLRNVCNLIFWRILFILLSLFEEWLSFSKRFSKKSLLYIKDIVQVTSNNQTVYKICCFQRWVS